MSRVTTEVYNADEFRRMGHEIIDLIAEHLKKSTSNDAGNVNNWKTPNEQLKYWQTYPEKVDIKTLFSDIIFSANNLHNPKYIGHQVPPPAPAAALAAFLGSMLNNGMAIYEMGPQVTAIEKIVMNTFSFHLGYNSEADGFFTSGGTLANLTALIAARNIMSNNDVWEDGYAGEKLAVMVSSEAHYCVDKAARIMGFGNDGFIIIPVTDGYVMDTDLLQKHLDDNLKKGIKVIAVVGSACSTSTGTYDDLSKIADFAEKNSLWFHVDGAHGGAAIFSSKYKNLMKGIERADSVVIDCHKMLMAPALATALIFKNGKDSYKTFHQKAQYLWEKEDDLDWYNYGKRTMECTKLMMNLKFFVLFKLYGIDIFDEHVTALYDRGKEFAELVKTNKAFELAVNPQSNIVCFRLNNPTLTRDQKNDLNKRVRKFLLEDGEYYIVQTVLNGNVFLRTSIMNPFTEMKHFERLLQKIEDFVKS